MSLNDRIMNLVDGLYSALPRRTPPASVIKAARIVAHRGLHEAPNVKENSRTAFELALKENLWGIEFDVRWTKDEVPLILHDPDPYRVYPELKARLKLALRELKHSEILEATDEVVPLAEVVQKFAPRMHLMIEIKEPLDTPQKKEHFRNILKHLKPAEDFHILSLDPELFESVDFLPPHCFLPVAEWNIETLSELSLKNGWAGLTGHYLLLRNKIRRTHQKQQQACGTGFINSKFLLYRELHRDMDWIFTDKAMTIKSLLAKALIDPP